jgi:hypothetical protein
MGFRRPRSLHRCFAAPASNTFATLAYRSFAGDLQRSVFAPRFRDHHQMPFKNPMRRWRRIELPPVDAPLLPGECRMILRVMCHVLPTKAAATVSVHLWVVVASNGSHWWPDIVSRTAGLKGCLHPGFLMCTCNLAR